MEALIDRDAGEYFEYSSTKNMFDHLIENGDFPLLIIVSATAGRTK